MSKVKSKKRIEVGFDGGMTTSDGGFVLLSEVDRREGLSDSIAECIEDSRCVRHEQCELIRQRVYQIAMGYEGRLRHSSLWLRRLKLQRCGQPSLRPGLENSSWEVS